MNDRSYKQNYESVNNIDLKWVNKRTFKNFINFELNNHTNQFNSYYELACFIKYLCQLLNDNNGLNYLRIVLKQKNVNLIQYDELYWDKVDDNVRSDLMDFLINTDFPKKSKNDKTIILENNKELIRHNVSEQVVEENIKMLTPDEIKTLDLLITCRDSDSADEVYKLIGDNIVCFNSKTLEYYVFNEKHMIWQYKTHNRLLSTVSKPLIKLTENAIKIIEIWSENHRDSIDITDQRKIEDYQLLLKKLYKYRQELGKSTFIKKVLEWLLDLVVDENFTSKINKITYLLPIKNNLVIDCRDGNISSRLKNHYFTFSCDVSYGNETDINGNKADHSENIKQFYLDISNRNLELYNFFQVFFGLCLTGEMPKYIYFIYGKGSNGKSVMMRILKRILGNKFYATLNNSIFIETKAMSSANAHTSYLQGIIESRVGVAGELAETDVLNRKLLKSISGSDDIRARHCSEKNEFEINTQSKLILPVNEIPKFPSTDRALIDRLVFIPTTIKFIDEVYDENENLMKLENGFAYKNKEMTNNMENNHEYINDIFKWMIQGSIKYYKQNLQFPECVVNAKKECLLSNDKLQQFLDQNLIVNTSGVSKVKDLLMLYQYGSKYNTSANAITLFCKDLRARGYKIEPLGARGDKRTMHIYGYTFEMIDEKKSNVI
jgi:P4 family phage/plasmid primase-like protien